VAWTEAYAYLRTKWYFDPSSRLATIDMGRKLGAVMLTKCCTPLGRGVGFSFITMWPGLRPTGVPSFTLIHPTVWPQYTNVTDRTAQRSDSIWGEPFWARGYKTLRPILSDCCLSVLSSPVLYCMSATLVYLLGHVLSSPSLFYTYRRLRAMVS